MMLNSAALTKQFTVKRPSTEITWNPVTKQLEVRQPVTEIILKTITNTVPWQVAISKKNNYECWHSD